MPGLLETRQLVKMCFCMTSFSGLSGKLRSPEEPGGCAPFPEHLFGAR
jgi:hypothetical protein